MRKPHISRVLRSRTCCRFARRIAAVAAVCILVLSIREPLWGQAVNAQPLNHDFGSVNLGLNSQTTSIQFTFTDRVQISSIAVLMQGAVAKDFQESPGSTCEAGNYGSGSSCTVNVSFTPMAPGGRKGAVVLFDTSMPPKPLATAYVFGTGVGPAIGFNTGTVRTVAGNGHGKQATDADLKSPTRMAVDGGGNLYIVDPADHRILKVSPIGEITTVAGNGSAGYDGDDGPAISAQLNTPEGLAIDGAGNLYIADCQNNVIRKVDTGGTISTIAGSAHQNSGDPETVGDYGPATSAHLWLPTDVAVDGAGNLFIADSANNRIRKVAPDGTITTVAGNGTPGFSGDNGAAPSAQLDTPLGLTVDSAGTLYVADSRNNRIRRVDASGNITSLVGNGSAGGAADGAAAIGAELSAPESVAIDAAGTLYIASHDCRTRKVTPDGLIATVVGAETCSKSGDAGGGSSAQPHYPGGVAVDSAGNLYVADSSGHRILEAEVSDPPALAFVSAGVESFSPAQDVRIVNLGNAQLAITQIDIAPNFTLQEPNTSCVTTGQTLDPADSCNLEIESQATGSFIGTLVLADNALNVRGARHVVPLSAMTEQASQTISFAPLPVMTYGDPPFTVTATDDSGLAVSFSATGNCSVTNDIVSITGAGSCTITASQSGDASYAAAAEVKQTFTINQASLTVSANNQSQSYNGTPCPAFAVSYRGFVNNESPLVLGGKLVFSGSAAGAFNAGTYTIVPGGLTSNNYAISYQSGTLIITKAVPTVTVTGGTYAFDGNLHAAAATATGVGGVKVYGMFKFTYVPGGVAATVDPGTYTASASFVSADPNYADASSSNTATITVTGTLAGGSSSAAASSAAAASTAGSLLASTNMSNLLPNGAPTMPVTMNVPDISPDVNMGSVADPNSMMTTVDHASSITSESNTVFQVGQTGMFKVMTLGVPRPTLSESGALPKGVSFDPSTGMLSGMPAVGAGGVYYITFTASNGIGPDAEQSFTLKVLDFSLSEIGVIKVAANESAAKVTVSVSPIAGFSPVVKFTVTNLPNGVSAVFDPPFVKPAEAELVSSTMTVRIPPSLSSSTFTFTVMATSGLLSHSTAATVTVLSAKQVPVDQNQKAAKRRNR